MKCNQPKPIKLTHRLDDRDLGAHRLLRRPQLNQLVRRQRRPLGRLAAAAALLVAAALAAVLGGRGDRVAAVVVLRDDLAVGGGWLFWSMGVGLMQLVRWLKPNSH
jgi:hypothetical protein